MHLITLTQAAEILQLDKKYAQNKWRLWARYGVHGYRPLGTKRVMFDLHEIQRAITASKIN